MTDLLSQLQSATEGSYSLSCKVGDFMGAERRYEHPGVAEPSHRHYTTNLQDAVSLVPKGLGYIRLEQFSDGWYATIATRSYDPMQYEGSQKPAALALCIAIIKAHESKAEAA